MVTLSRLGPQIALDGAAGMAFHCGLYHSVVSSEYQEDKNRNRKASQGLGLDVAQYHFRLV